MIVIPAILLQQGTVTAAPAAATGLTDPLAAVRAIEREGAPLVHIEDLDLRAGHEPQGSVYERLAADMRPFQVGGGIDDVATAEALLALGADRVVLADLPFRDPAAAKRMADRAPARVVATLSLAGGEVAGQPLAKAIKVVAKLDLRTIVLLGEGWTGDAVAEVSRGVDALLLLGGDGEAASLRQLAAGLGEAIAGILAFPAPAPAAER